jgi:CubicO group peptidase (beta-lactamase class C family)
MNKLFIFLFALPTTLFGQAPAMDSLQAFIAKQVLTYKIPGMAIGIIHNNQVVLKSTYGVTSTITNQAVSSQTIFPISSCTKAFTAACLGLLVDQGKLSWHDKVVKYLPEFKLSDPWITSQLTISDLLTHRSGLGRFEGDLLWYGSHYTRKEIVHRIRYFPLKHAFRLEFAYQNVMYIVAGLVIEAVSGKSWDAFVEEHLFTALGMSHSSTTLAQLLSAGSYAQPHLKNKPIAVVSMDNLGPAGSINSTIDDLLHWLQMWIEEGKWQGKQVLSKQTVETMTSRKMMLAEDKEEGYGYGWYIGDEGGQKAISHNGGMPGYKSSILLLPEQKLGIVILTNKISYLHEELLGIIVAYLREPHSFDWAGAEKSLYFKNFTFSWDQPIEIDTTLQGGKAPTLTTYRGEYEDKVYGKALITEKEGKPFLELLPSRELLSGYLSFLDKDRFQIIFQDPFLPPGELIFETRKGIISFTLYLPSEDLSFEGFVFKKIH